MNAARLAYVLIGVLAVSGPFSPSYAAADTTKSSLATVAIPPGSRGQNEAPPPLDRASKHPPRSGDTDLPLQFVAGSIRARISPEMDIGRLMSKYGLNGTAVRINHPPFGRAALRAGLDREYRIPVPSGSEKDTVRLFAQHPDEWEFVQMDWVQQDLLTLSPNDSLYQAGYQGNLAALGMPSAWDITVASSSIVIAFIGTGIRATNQDLAGKQVLGRDFSVYPAVNIEPGTAHDPCDHETLVAGAGAAVTNNGTGIAGTGFNSAIMPVKAWTDTCQRSANYTRADAISWAFDNGAAVINLSYEHYDPDGGEANIINSIYSYGGHVVASAGNDNRDTATYPTYPCSGPGVFCIGASDNSGNRWKTGDTSQCYFPTPDPGTTTPSYCGSNFGTDVDYAAPGIGIWSTSNVSDATYEAGTGTSMAAPQAAGILALLKSTGCTPPRSHEALYNTASRAMSPWTTFGFINAGSALHWFGASCPA